MKPILKGILAGAAALIATAGVRQRPNQDARHRQEPRQPELRRQRRPRRLQPARRQGQLDRPRRRLLQGDRRGGPRRRHQGQVRADHGEGALHRPAVGRDRRADPQHHLDHRTRQLARPHLRRRQLLRRPGLHGERLAGRQDGQGAQRRHRLRADRHHHRAQPRRLLQGQQDDLQAGRVREARRDLAGLSGRSLRRLHDGPVRPLLDARAAAQARRPRGAARDHLQGAARSVGAPGRRPVADRRQVGALRVAECRGGRHHPGQRRRDGRIRPIPRSSASSARTASSARISAFPTISSSSIVKAVGNYGELFERNVGTGSRLKIARGLNKLWNKGGLQYAPPLR